MRSVQRCCAHPWHHTQECVGPYSAAHRHVHYVFECPCMRHDPCALKQPGYCMQCVLCKACSICVPCKAVRLLRAAQLPQNKQYLLFVKQAVHATQHTRTTQPTARLTTHASPHTSHPHHICLPRQVLRLLGTLVEFNAHNQALARWEAHTKPMPCAVIKVWHASWLCAAAL